MRDVAATQSDTSAADTAHGPFARAENLLLALTLGAMALLPIAEVVLRATFAVGIAGTPVLTQHLGLVVAMLGAAVAARDHRLLALSALPTLLHGRTAAAARLIANTTGTAVCAVMALTAAQFVATERLAANTIAFGFAAWWVQLVMPVGFGVIAWHLLRHTTPGIRGQALAAALGLALLGLAAFAPLAPTDLIAPGLALLGVATVLGTPVFVTLGGVTLLLFWGEGYPLASIAVDQYRMVVNPTLPAIPLFTLAGYFLAEGGAPTRLVRVFRALFTSFHGGAAIAAVFAGSLFTCLTGASGVAILALGGLLMPLLIALRYSERDALGLVTGAGLPGILLLPSLPLILYAIVADVNIRAMFLGALLPMFVMLGLTAWWGVRRGPRADGATPAFDAREVRAAIGAAKWELALPAVALAALFSGLATPVEAAALTALYAFVVEVFIYRDLTLTRDVPRVMAECGLLVGGVMLILGVALGLSNYFVDAEIPAKLTAWLDETVRHKWLFLLALNLFLLLAGCLMDVFSAIIVIAPLLVPIGRAFGIDPIHLGVIFLANLELGFLTPPVGINLFFASYRFRKPVLEVCRSVATLLPVQLAGVLLITYLPWLTTFLPGLLIER